MVGEPLDPALKEHEVGLVAPLPQESVRQVDRLIGIKPRRGEPKQTPRHGPDGATEEGRGPHTFSIGTSAALGYTRRCCLSIIAPAAIDC